MVKYLRFKTKVEHTGTRALKNLKQAPEKIMKIYISKKLLMSLNFALKNPLYT